jgi:hypothetical protein
MSWTGSYPAKWLPCNHFRVERGSLPPPTRRLT